MSQSPYGIISEDEPQKFITAADVAKTQETDFRINCQHNEDQVIFLNHDPANNISWYKCNSCGEVWSETHGEGVVTEPQADWRYEGAEQVEEVEQEQEQEQEPEANAG